jgi:iron complex transport system permease protein
MTASAVAISGPIGFVGLICPHLGRLVVGHDLRRLLPLAAALGAALLASADAASRAMIPLVKTWPPVGVLTALLGGPFFLYLLYRERNP